MVSTSGRCWCLWKDTAHNPLTNQILHPATHLPIISIVPITSFLREEVKQEPSRPSSQIKINCVLAQTSSALVPCCCCRLIAWQDRRVVVGYTKRYIIFTTTMTSIGVAEKFASSGRDSVSFRHSDSGGAENPEEQDYHADQVNVRDHILAEVQPEAWFQVRRNNVRRSSAPFRPIGRLPMID